MNATPIAALLTAILTGLFPSPSRAESVVVQWEKTYNGPGNGMDWAAAVAVDSAGNVIVNGTSLCVDGFYGYTAKYAAANGALLWEKRCNPLNSSGFVAVDSAGNVISSGFSHTVKFAAANGALLWERNNGPAGAGLVLDSAGNVIVAGVTESPRDMYTANYAAANGALVWEKRYDSGARDWAYDVAVDSGGNVFVTGGSGSNIDYYTAKYAAANGALLWETRYDGGGQDEAHGVVADSQGNAIVTGKFAYPGNEVQYTAKYAAADGALLWEKRVVGPFRQGYHGAIALDDADNPIISDGGLIAKYAAADGALHWEHRHSQPGISYGPVAVDDAGNVVVTGSSSGDDDNTDTYTAKYAAADGALLWEKRYNGTRNFRDWAVGVAVDNAGGTIVVGVTNDQVGSDPGTADFYTVKYVPADGDGDGLLDSWEVTHFGSTAAHSALDDTDGDGGVELLELAFGADPKSPASVPAPAVVVEGGYLTTTIAKQSGVTYLVQTSATLESGFSALSTTVLTDTTSTLKVRDNIALGAQARRFLRVQVTAAP